MDSFWTTIHILILFALLNWFFNRWTVAIVGVLAVGTLVEYSRFGKPPEERILRLLSDLSGPIAFKGAASDAPENTLAALKHCVGCGVAAVTLDVGLTKDYVLILMYDETLDRTTNGTGPVSNFTFQELQQFDAASHHATSSQVGKQYIISLKQAVQYAHRYKVKLFLNVKEHDADIAIRKLVDLHLELPYLTDTCVFYSLTPYTVYRLRSYLPQAVVGLAYDPQYYQYTPEGDRKTQNPFWHQLAFLKDRFSEWCHLTWIWYLVGNSVFIVHKTDISPNYVKFWANRGITVIAWLVNDPREKAYFDHIKIPYLTDTLTTYNIGVVPS